ncbi:MAG: hypothetical protein RLZZ568_2133, partial [Cyanobacteriota bacterium]
DVAYRFNGSLEFLGGESSDDLFDALAHD